MKVMIIACSKKAYALMNRLKGYFAGEDVLCVVKCSALPDVSEKESLSCVVKREFEQIDLMVVVGATGIAVRLVAPHLVHKSVDPAVVVVDESGTFCISLLSGHAGGANEWTGKLAHFLGATPVITTATDCENVFAVDEFARKNEFVLSDWEYAKKISAAILAGEKIGIECDCGWDMPKLPPELMDAKKQGTEGKTAPRLRIVISDRQSCGIGLQLIPKDIVVGLGCRRNTPKEVIEKAIVTVMNGNGLCMEAIASIASIDLKQEELGIVEWAREHGMLFETFTAKELEEVVGEFSKSEFVQSVTGVANVCERSAVKASGLGALIAPRQVVDGVTVALARKKGKISFE